MIEPKVHEYESDDALTRLADMMEELNDGDCSSRTRFLVAEAREQRQGLINEITGLQSSFDYFMDDVYSEFKDLYIELNERYFLKDTEEKLEEFIDRICKRIEKVCKNINNEQVDKQREWQENEWRRGY